MTHKTVRAVATRLGDRNAAGLLIACFIVIFTYHLSVPFFYKKISLKEGQVWRESFSKVIVTFVTQGLPSSFSAVLLLKFINDQKWCVPFSWIQNACQLLIRLDATSEHALRCSIWNQRQIIILNVITIVFNLHHMIRIMCIARAAFSVFESPKIQSVCNHPPPLPAPMLHELLFPNAPVISMLRQMQSKEFPRNNT